MKANEFQTWKVFIRKEVILDRCPHWIQNYVLVSFRVFDRDISGDYGNNTYTAVDIDTPDGMNSEYVDTRYFKGSLSDFAKSYIEDYWGHNTYDYECIEYND